MDKDMLVISLLKNLEIESNWKDSVLYVKRKEGIKDATIDLYAYGVLMAVFGRADRDVILYG